MALEPKYFSFCRSYLSKRKQTFNADMSAALHSVRSLTKNDFCRLAMIMSDVQVVFLGLYGANYLRINVFQPPAKNTRSTRYWMPRKKKVQADGSSCKHDFSVILLRMRCQWYGERICLRTAAPLSTHLAPPIILRSTLKKCKYFSSHVWVSLSTMKETNFSLRRFFVYFFFFLFGCIVATRTSMEGWEIGTHPPTSWKIWYCEIGARLVMPAHTVSCM